MADDEKKRKIKRVEVWHKITKKGLNSGLKMLKYQINNMPHTHHRHTQKERRNSAVFTLPKLFKAYLSCRQRKPKKIRQASAVFDQLKTRLRMAHELNLFSHKKYAYIIEQNEKIGKMINGWLKWAEKQ